MVGRRGIREYGREKGEGGMDWIDDGVDEVLCVRR